jgi:hypothetical protein
MGTEGVWTQCPLKNIKMKNFQVKRALNNNEIGNTGGRG